VADNRQLYETINEKAFKIGLTKPKVPEYIQDNIKYNLYDWQRESLENFLTYNAIKEGESPNSPTHLMFNMATGSGKTLIMASTLLYYYKKGYRHFIFFVNANNVVDKTENNFLDETHNKYLFKKKIVIDDKPINIKKVDVFSDHAEDIEIKFTTIQQLYNDIHIQKENQTTLEDLHKRDIVMLADEAHHLNANTKKSGQTNFDFESEITNRTGKNDVERKGWEHTVIELILNKNREYKINNNVLLEFTATMPSNQNVAEKYRDKIIYKFGLKEFLKAGYTKEINLISSTLEKKERILQALLFHWYRHKIALKYDLSNFKPVILFRSKTIKESKEDYKEFLKIIGNLKIKDFNFIKNIEDKIHQADDIYQQGISRTRDVLEFIKKEDIRYAEIVDFLKYNFKKINCIITNSKDNKAKTIEKTTEEQEKLLNNLEDKNNHIRAIFTVKRLTEGWDVLNLYDIVRLYKGQNTGGSTREVPKATVQEKQLIGRGVRYYPFQHKDKLPNKRKFDSNIEHELRVLEELYYYTYDEKSRYISHLKKELKKDGYIQDDKVVKTFKLKEDFKEKTFYDKVKIWYNKQEDNPDRQKNTLKNIKKDFSFTHRINQFELNEQEINLERENDRERLNIKDDSKKHTIIKSIKDFERHIFNKALNIKAQEINSLFQFSQLKNELNINGREDLLKDKFLGDFQIQIVCENETDFESISNQEKLNILLDFLHNFSKKIQKMINPVKGGDFKPGSLDMFFGDPKTKIIVSNEESQIKEEILKEKDWYVLDSFHGTDQELALIDFIINTIGNLKEKYQEVYLLRNEEMYKIYDFEKGRGFQPDFIMFLKDKEKENLNYQIFIEPKGEFLLEKDDWKNKFLKEITHRYSVKDILKFENEKYNLIGLPLFNENNNMEFEKEYNKITNS
jgi:type III restriction enzyme